MTFDRRSLGVALAVGLAFFAGVYGGTRDAGAYPGSFAAATFFSPLDSYSGTVVEGGSSVIMDTSGLYNDFVITDVTIGAIVTGGCTGSVLVSIELGNGKQLAALPVYTGLGAAGSLPPPTEVRFESGLPVPENTTLVLDTSSHLSTGSCDRDVEIYWTMSGFWAAQ